MAITIQEQEDGAFEFVSDDEFQFEDGSTINPLTLVYESYGTLNKNRDNAIVVHHALSTSSHLSTSDKNPVQGWWEDMVGPGCHLDSNKYFIICINNLGSCFGSSSPVTLNSKTGEPYRASFPRVSIVDMVRSQKMLIDSLGIEHLHAVLGNSMGAMLSITWLALYPDHARHLISISSSAQAYPANNANRFLQRDIIIQDRAWKNGNYISNADLQGFLTARKLGLLTYRNWAELNERFVNKTGADSIEHYLQYNADKFIRRFDCNSYLTLLDAMNTFNLSSPNESLTQVFKGISAKTLIVSVDSDILFTPSQQEALYLALCDAGVDTQLIEHSSSYGHDAFLIETAQFGSYISQFIAN
ncbi:MAG: homoserine O-acetyltransferase [Halioglobus sp.]